MNTNRISATLSQTDQDAVLTAIATIRQKLPFLIDLTTAERVTIPKLGDKTQAFVKKALDVAAQNPDMLPAGSFLEEMRKDAQLFENLAPIRLAIDLLQKQVDDTTTQVGGEAYASARTIYTVSKTPFARAALRTAADDLGKRFSRKVQAAAPETPPAPAPPDAPPTNHR